MRRGTLVAGNWKMNLELDAARALATAVAGIARPAGVEVAVFPPFPWLVPVREALGESGVALGAQHCYTQPSGAFTGEVSPTMLAGLCEYVLAGHSERRHVFGESDELVGAKVAAILAAGLRPVLCVGELLDERQAGRAQEVVGRQLRAGLADVGDTSRERVTIAYEPVWAIGTGVAATPADAQEMSAMIRGWLLERWGTAGEAVRILYGGSVTADNARELLGQPDVDGALVGGASLKADSFGAIVRAAESGGGV